MEKKAKQNVKYFFKYVVFSMLFITVLALSLFKFIDILPSEYFIVLCVFLGLINFGLASLVLSKRGHKKRAIGIVLSIIYIIILILGIIYELNTIGFLKKLGVSYKTENYNVIVLKENKYETLADLSNRKIGSLSFNTEGLKAVRNKIEKKIKVQFITYETVDKLKEALIEKEVDGAIIEDSLLSILSENDSSFAKIYKTIYKSNIDIEIDDIKKEVDITEDSFNIFISGIDSYLSVTSASRSDVNIVLSVNPKTNSILVTSIPRDYYVNLADINEYDKLTHSGIYGIETTVKTVEDLLGININYYVKLNFQSLVNLVNALGGVEVYSNYQFTSVDGYSYKKGYNTLDGKKALSFVRERKSFIGGDRVRIENQAAMIEAIIDKAIDPSIIINYNSFLKALENTFVTNLDMNSITEFIKKQIDDYKPWNLTSISLEGTDNYQYTYSYKANKLYVMIPNEESVVNAREKILEIL